MSIRAVAVLVGVLFVSVVLALWLFAQAPIPRYPGDDNPSHDGQPMWCQNHDTERHAKNCECKSMNPDGEGCNDSGTCKVYCRKSACRCISPCTT